MRRAAVLFSAGLTLFAIRLPAAQTAIDHPLAGHWTADLSRSTLHPNAQVQATTLRFAVLGDTVSVTESVISPSGQEQGHGTSTFQTDGQPHPHDELLPGLIVVAKWSNPRTLDTVLTRRDGHVDHVTYQVSPDGKTLITTTAGDLGNQIIVFDRR